MTVIGTNTASLRAGNASNSANMSLQNAMERLSTGKRINSAKDDAAGLAIASRMTSQLRSMAVAVRNANDGVSMAQTAEGALGEVTSMLQRMKELATQSANGTLGTSERAALQTEVTQLTSQINDISRTTNFNGQNLLDGSVKGLKLQTGTTAADTVSLSLDGSSAQALGLNGAQAVTGRAGGTITNNLKLNGKAVYAGASNAVGSAKQLAADVNGNASLGVIATASNNVKSSVVSGTISNGTINGKAVAGATDAASLVNTINNNASTYGVNAKLNDDGTITLSNNDGSDISTTGGAFGTNTNVHGFVALSNKDGSALKVTGGTTDLASVGLNASDGAALTSNSASLPTLQGISDLSDVKINGVAIGKVLAGSSADVQGTAITSTASSIDLSALTINGTSVGMVSDTTSPATATSNANAIRDKINGLNLGITASVDGSQKITLHSDSGQPIVIGGTTTGSGFTASATPTQAQTSSAIADKITKMGAGVVAQANADGTLSLSSTNGQPARIEGTNAYTKLGLNASGGTGNEGAGIDLTTQAGASASLAIIDKALDGISATRGNLGAIQNRLQVTVNNLTTTSTNLSDAKSRIEDADFSTETAALAKAQILSQASTAMLAQANQSQQGVLKLLQ